MNSVEPGHHPRTGRPVDARSAVGNKFSGSPHPPDRHAHGRTRSRSLLNTSGSTLPFARELAEELVVRFGREGPGTCRALRSYADNFERELDTITTRSKSTNRPQRRRDRFVTLDRWLLSDGPALRADRRAHPARQPQRSDELQTSSNFVKRRSVKRAARSSAAPRRRRRCCATGRRGLAFPCWRWTRSVRAESSGGALTLEMLRYNLQQLEKGVALSKPRERQRARSARRSDLRATEICAAAG
jgi:hypothetical protein